MISCTKIGQEEIELLCEWMAGESAREFLACDVQMSLAGQFRWIGERRGDPFTTHWIVRRRQQRRSACWPLWTSTSRTSATDKAIMCTIRRTIRTSCPHFSNEASITMCSWSFDLTKLLLPPLQRTTARWAAVQKTDACRKECSLTTCSSAENITTCPCSA